MVYQTALLRGLLSSNFATYAIDIIKLMHLIWSPSGLAISMVKISAVVYLYVRGYLKVETSFGCAECVVLLVPHLCHRCVLTKETKKQYTPSATAKKQDFTKSKQLNDLIVI